MTFRNCNRLIYFCFFVVFCIRTDIHLVDGRSEKYVSYKSPKSENDNTHNEFPPPIEVDPNDFEETNITIIYPWDGDKEIFTRAVVPKCCDLENGFSFEAKSTCVETEDEFLPDFEDRPDYSEIAKELPVQARYEYYLGDPCSDGKYILDIAKYSYDSYKIYSNGTLLYLDQLYSKEEFCIETLNATIRVFICFGVDKNEFKKDFKLVLYAIGLLISVPFLLATALIYLGIELLRDLRGKSLSCHVLSLAIAYIFLALVQLASNQLNEDMCIAAGFIIQFFFVSAFFWLNVICYDTWRCIKKAFCSIHKPVNPKSEKITFCYYVIYAFYGPLVLSIVSLVMDLEPAIPESYLKPHFGFTSCWFYSDAAALPYFYGPIGISIFINFIFFILSIRKIYKEQKERTLVLHQSNIVGDGIQEKLPSIKIYMKTLKECIFLFCLMGINWGAEIISWAVGGTDVIWMVADIFNTLQGITIFYLFVLRPQCVRKEVKRRMWKACKKITTCDFSQNDSKFTNQHCHLHCYEMTETCLASENNKFIATASQS